MFSSARRRRVLRRSLVSTALAAALATVALGCGSATGASGSSGSTGSDSGASGPGSGSGPGGQLAVVAGFYPLEYAAHRIAGNRATITDLTPPGAEPHDLELTPQQVASVGDAQLVIYLGRLQPAVDNAVGQSGVSGPAVLNVARYASLKPYAASTGADATSAGSDAAEQEGGGNDPHFWLDPIRYRAVTDAIAKRFAAVDPRHAQAYASNAAKLRADLNRLDTEYRKGLAHCANTDLVTSHEAFRYLAERYGLTQIGINGLSPEQEPSPARLAQVATFVRTHHVRTIYYETLVPASIADTVARETGARTDVLDPIEGLTKTSKGHDYLEVMRSNLAALRKGQACR